MFLEESWNKFDTYIFHIKKNLAYYEEAVNIVSSEDHYKGDHKFAKEAEDIIYRKKYDYCKSTVKYKYSKISLLMENIKLYISEYECPVTTKDLKKKLTKVKISCLIGRPP